MSVSKGFSARSEHTPGPWVAVEDANGWTLEGRGMSVTAEAFDCSNADARLIAAAPDMLAALERFAEAMKQHSHPELQGIACDAFAAIAKARGQE